MKRAIQVSLGVSIICFLTQSASASYKAGNCLRTDEASNICVEEEVLSTDSSNMTDKCTSIGGTFHSMGACVMDPSKLKELVSQAQNLEPKPVYQGLLAYVKQCESVANNTVRVCNSSSGMITRARGLMNLLNDMIAAQSAMSAADACTGMQDAVSGSRVQLKAWQKTCGEALTTCQQACETTLVSVKGNVELTQMTTNAIQKCQGFFSQRDDVTRSVAMGNSAVESSKLCQQQLGGDQVRDRKQETARASDSPIVPLTPLPTSPGRMDSNYSAPTMFGPGTIQPAQTTLQHQAVTRSTGDSGERDVQGARRRPPTTPTAETAQTGDAKKQQSQGERNSASGSPVRFPSGVARSTLDGTNRVGNNSQGWPIPAHQGVHQASAGTFAPGAGGIPVAVQAFKEARKIVRPKFGPITREPSNVETTSLREIGVAGRGANMFRNIHIQFLRLSGTLVE